MMKRLTVGGLDCLCAVNPEAKRIVYILYPMDSLVDWIGEAVEKYGVTIVQLTGMDWESVFSPWPVSGVPKDSADFKGESPQFLKFLQDTVIPRLEKELGITPGTQRDLIGVSMSGLFALWQWMVCDTFTSIISLSGSFWYSGFIEWIENIKIPSKTGKAFFLLGEKEPHASIPEFRSVGDNTLAIIDLLRKANIDCSFQWVRGDHFSDPIQRLDKAFTAVYL